MYYNAFNIVTPFPHEGKSFFVVFCQKEVVKVDIVGIVAEYNPLHTGHLRHLALTRAACPGALIVVCMSGNWVQRGECAIADKWQRARWAAEHGVDLVLELPTVFAMSSAQTFARSAVSILTAAGVSHLSFGCETPDLPRLQALGLALNSPDFDTAIGPFLEQGLSYPAARQRALEGLVGGETAALVEKPNNNLAVEYLSTLSVDVTPIAIPRLGDHDGPLEQEYPSASAIRSLLLRGDITQAQHHLAAPWQGPVYDIRRLETSILCKLRQMPPEDLAALPDGSDGLGQRLWKAAREAGSLEQLYTLAKTKRFTAARIRRLALWAALGLTANDRPAAPEYLRVLAMTQAGAAHLAGLKKTCPLPILTKPADHKELLQTESRLTDIFALCAPSPAPCGAEWIHSPAVI